MKAIKLVILSILIAAIATLSPYALNLASDLMAEPATVQTASASIEIKPLVLDAGAIAQKVNDYRASKGLTPLTTSEQLNASACAKADDMIANHYWSHDSPTGIPPWYWFDQAGYHFKNAGENLAYGYASETAVVDGWINSASHEATMRGNFAEQGMCARSAMFRGQQTVVVVNHFGLR